MNVVLFPSMRPDTFRAMSRTISRRAILTGLAGIAATPMWANAPTTSKRPVLRPLSARERAALGPEPLIKAANLRGEVGFAVVDVATGEVLESYGTEITLPPASVNKAVTALYALSVLGGDHRFETRLVGNGPIVDGVLKGDLILEGGGDPTLDTDDLVTLAKSLAATGVRRVDGRFLVYGGALPSVDTIDGSQPPHVGYSPAISGLCLNFNRVYFDWKVSGANIDVTMEARGKSLRPPVRVARMDLSDRRGPVFEYESRNGQDRWSVARNVLKKDGGRWLPVRQPELYAGEAFAWIANRQGVALPTPEKTSSRPNGDVLVSHQSGDLTSILRDMLKYSTNVTAEMVGLAATKAKGQYAASLLRSARDMETWAKTELGMQKAKFVDHSGLGDASRMNAQELAKALVVLGQRDVLEPILKDIVLKNSQGGPDRDHPIKVRAKTGTLNFVSGLSGYMHAPDGRVMSFAIFAADAATRAALTRAQRERPRGAQSWNARAKKLQQQLIERWGLVYAG